MNNHEDPTQEAKENVRRKKYIRFRFGALVFRFCATGTVLKGQESHLEGFSSKGDNGWGVIQSGR